MTTFDPADSSRWTDPDHTGYTDDQWHAHSGEMPPQASHGAVTPRVIFAVGLAGFLLVVVCVVIIAQYFTIQSQQEIAAKQEVDISAEARSARAQWAEQLSGFGWVDPKAGAVRVPIEVAMETVAERYAAAAARGNQ